MDLRISKRSGPLSNRCGVWAGSHEVHRGYAWSESLGSVSLIGCCHMVSSDGWYFPIEFRISVLLIAADQQGFDGSLPVARSARFAELLLLCRRCGIGVARGLARHHLPT